MSGKFHSEIDKITNQMLESAQRSDLGRKVVRDHIRQDKTGVSRSLKGDLALVNLNSKVAELELLSDLRHKLHHGTEDDFMNENLELMLHVAAKGQDGRKRTR